MDKMRGVNLGGWLVLERWISPSVFAGTSAPDEHSLMNLLDSKTAETRIRTHRDKFITESHIDQLQNLGLTALRLPVGYWLFDDIDGFVGGADFYVDQLFGWAKRRGMSVVLCFHAAPGSQNGWDHSGKSGAISWVEPVNIKASHEFLELLTKRYGYHDNLVGIEILNEPHWSIDLEILHNFYQAAGRVVERNCHPGVAVIVSDSFRPTDIINWLPKLDLKKVILDCHLYQLFTEEDRALNLTGHLEKAKRWAKELKRYDRYCDVMVGEWSAAMSELYNPITDERQHRYRAEDYAVYAKIQRQSFARAGAGWFYWTARTEDAGIWSLVDHPEIVS